jgi:GAF domain-containing protein
VQISLEGRLWGLIGVASRHEELPADTEAWLAGCTELVAAAIANTQARAELRGYAEEQAALRRVATLVARATSPEQMFAAVTAEVGRLLGLGARKLPETSSVASSALLNRGMSLSTQCARTSTT